MLCSGRVAVRGLGPVYESHPDAVFLVVLPAAVLAVGVWRLSKSCTIIWSS
jgi:hypothetical protein